jgi:thiamine pyrophosphate-dependent acetolactate synthase large subunit-like protein
MATDRSGNVRRRSFLKGVGAAGAAAVGGSLLGSGEAAAAPASPGTARVTFPPSAPGAAKLVERPGSDFMVDVLKALQIEYVASNPGSSFRGLQESIVTYGGNQMPEFLTCMHEESSVAMAHGYAKAAGKPMAVLAHSTVGLQHAAMAVYNAWCDRVPVLLLAGNMLNLDKRRPGVEWYHCAQDPAVILRDFTKWDDQPTSLQGFAESTVRAYKLAMTPPMEPVVVVADAELQESAIEHEETLYIPRPSPAIPPAGDPNAVREAARLLAAAENPVIVVDRATRSQEGVERLVALAEALHAPVIDLGGRMNMPTDHYLNLSGMRGQLVRNADLILALEVADLWGVLNTVADPTHEYRRVAKPDVQVISISMGELYGKSNYQDFQRFQPVDLAIAGDPQATLPSLVEEVRRAAGGRMSLLSQRSDQLRSMHQDMKQRIRSSAAYAWNARPITSARLVMETYDVIKGEDWSLVAGGQSTNQWTGRLWSMTKHYNHMGGSGGAGVGYSTPASVGAALANRAKGVLSVAFPGDGDAMYAPGVLWTAAHHQIPLLMVVYNNRAYHQETMHLQKMAGLRNRRPDLAHIGTNIYSPNVDFAKIAEGCGVYSIGPVEDPDALGSALKQALAVVKSGQPALVDAVVQPR